MIVLAVIFWGSLAVVAYTYAGYPLLLALLARLRPRTIRVGPTEPSVSLLVAAYNEERSIGRKIENLLALEYPTEKREIIVASDGSSDATESIVASYAARGVRLLALPRGGKTVALNTAAAEATSDVLVMTDATTEFAPAILRDLLPPFADPRVGCVAAELEYVGVTGSEVARGTGAYWRYERKLRELEGRVGSLIGCSGALYAVRRDAHRPVDSQLDDDFTMPGYVAEQGLITALARGAVSHEGANEDAAADFRMRVRVAIRAVNALVRRRATLNPARFGMFAVSMLSHKVLRYLAPVFLIAALAAHVGLVVGGAEPRWLYPALFAAHLGVYAAALLGKLSLARGWRLPLVHIPYYFVHMNAAALVGLVRYLGGDRAVTWDTAR